jgi:uncharacterized membrane protein SpoIIM required for sporulation
MKKRITFLLVFMGILSVVFLIGSEIKPDEKEAKEFVEKFNELIDDIKEGDFSLGIFFHNVKIAVPMFLPGVGVGWGFFAMFSTGLSVAALMVSDPMLAQMPPFTVLLTPFGLMEVVSYSLATSRSFLLLSKIVRRSLTKNDVRYTLMEVGMVVGLLLVAAFVEAYMINLIDVQPKIRFERMD